MAGHGRVFGRLALLWRGRGRIRAWRRDGGSATDLTGGPASGHGGTDASGLAGNGTAGQPGIGGGGGSAAGDAKLPGTGNEPGVSAPHCESLPPTVNAGVTENDKTCWFTFNMPWDDDSPNVTNMKHLLDAPAGKHGYLKVGVDGHFYFEDLPSVRARFNGVTLTAGANYPDKTLAPGIAARMARFGINMVRVTFEDYIPPNGLFKAPLTTTREFDPVQLDKLDWFLYQLKLHGIYVHLDFLSARPFLPGPFGRVDPGRACRPPRPSRRRHRGLTQGLRVFVRLDARIATLRTSFRRDQNRRNQPHDPRQTPSHENSAMHCGDGTRGKH